VWAVSCFELFPGEQANRHELVSARKKEQKQPVAKTNARTFAFIV